MLATTCSIRSAGPDQTYTVGGSGWALERFGGDVVILRSTIKDGANGSPGSLIVSCERGTRRLTLILPKSTRTAHEKLAAAGSLLIRPLGPSVARFLPVLAQTAGLRPDALILSEDPTSIARPVLAIAHILVARPNGLDFLLHIGNGRVTLNGLTPFRLVVSSREVDEVAFRDFATTCE